MSKYFTFAFLIFAAALFSACAQAEQSELYVFATELKVHPAPNAQEDAIGTLAYGDLVTVAQSDAENIATAPKDSWIKVKAAHLEGYVLSAYLLPIPAPDLARGDFQSLISLLPTIGKPETSETGDIRIISQTYGNGVILQERQFKMSDGEYFSEKQLFVADLSVFQGALLARAIASQEGLSSHRMSIVPQVQTSDDGALYVYDDNEWQVIMVNTAPGGVLIQFPERAD